MFFPALRAVPQLLNRYFFGRLSLGFAQRAVILASLRRDEPRSLGVFSGASRRVAERPEPILSRISA